MAKQRFLNNFTSIFIAAVKDAPSSGTPETELDYGVLRISDGAAGSLINPTDGDYYLLTAFKRSGSVESNIEVMRVTGVNNATPGECRITVQRAQEGTSAKAFVAGDYLSLRITKGTAENFSQPADLATKEPAIAAPVSAPTEKYWRGDKTWRDFFTDVRAATLTGLSTATSAVVAATDTVLAAIGKLQAQVSAKFDKTGGDVDGNINFTGTARRITGDFSNGAIANRVMFQTTTPNGQTSVGVLPNGAGGIANINVFGSSDPANSSLAQLVIAGEVALKSTATGSGAYFPLTFHAGNAERLRIDPTTGNVGIGTSAPASKFVVSDAGAQGLEILPNAAGATWISSFNRATDSATPLILQSSTLMFNTPSAHFLGVFGYGVGAGGTVVQATSKTTAVTLNKACGQITMHNAALDANGAVWFIVNNTFIGENDEVSVWLVNPVNQAVYDVAVDGLVPGIVVLRLRNNTSTSYSDSVVLGFAVRKGATS